MVFLWPPKSHKTYLLTTVGAGCDPNGETATTNK